MELELVKVHILNDPKGHQISQPESKRLYNKLIKYSKESRQVIFFKSLARAEHVEQ